ncbi:hypothetical protein LBWT_X3380 (plasmid) [Leptolyngbya boryana IAM M-101]|nr:hypothetical protein LBWT_X3380 [Leptolyngbya boryana IAM M-101]BAS66614.1 hypothetical protein LBDG_X3380 [Leptolyngbya boryana dg5]
MVFDELFNHFKTVVRLVKTQVSAMDEGINPERVGLYS